MRNSTRSIDGTTLLYHFLQKDLYESDIWMFQMLLSRMIVSLGIWFAPEIYQNAPVLLPFVVRDPLCRKQVGGEEQWGSADIKGYFRDDNSMIKALPRSLVVSGPRSGLYNGRQIGEGFTAAHVWRRIDFSSVDAELSSRDPLTNSFVPNLVWLPTQVAKLSDREGSFTQLYLQALSCKIYGELGVIDKFADITSEIWKMLPTPKGIPTQGLPDTETLNFFSPTKNFYSQYQRRITEILEAISEIEAGRVPEKKIIASRYGSSLSKLSLPALTNLKSSLIQFLP